MLMKKNKMHVRVGDTVKVISGNHRGAEGKILRVIREKNQVLIHGVRMIKRHLGRSQERAQGEIIEREGPLHISNVKLIEKVSAGKKTASHDSSKTSKKKEITQKEEFSKIEELPKKKSPKKASPSKQEK